MSELHIKLGALLKLERERQDRDLEDVAANLNMAPSTLEAIEAGDPSSSPSELYFELFTKSYAQLLGIDYSATVDAIKEEIGPELPPALPDKGDKHPPGNKRQAKPVEEEEDTKDSDSHLVKKLLYFVGAIIIVFLLFLILTKWVFSGNDGNNNEPAVDDTESSAEVDITNDEAAASTAEGYDWGVPDYTPPAGLALVLKPHNESWSTIVADGDTVLYRTLYPGRTYDVSAKYRLNVSIGIPSAVDVFLNDQEVNLRNPETGRIHDINIDRLNLEEIMARELPQKRSRPRPQLTETSVDNQSAPTEDSTVKDE
ncbi:MAG TPA: DUF4115 domain-containing protein [candidate division Zixibacteria bacterium]|nr:DUF4115 domain-containing protein [candidate division Zixibacteria bacterium]